MCSRQDAAVDRKLGAAMIIVGVERSWAEKMRPPFGWTDTGFDPLANPFHAEEAWVALWEMCGAQINIHWTLLQIDFHDWWKDIPLRHKLLNDQSYGEVIFLTASGLEIISAKID